MKRMARCCCGSLQAEAAGDPMYVIACHCSECRRRTGSVLGVGAYYKKELVQIHGHHKVFVRNAPEGRKVRNHFCPECGTALFWDVDRAPDLLGIAVGGFSDSNFPPPGLSIFERERHSWLQFTHEPQCFLGASGVADRQEGA
jgi:hypothetical protein